MKYLIKYVDYELPIQVKPCKYLKKHFSTCTDVQYIIYVIQKIVIDYIYIYFALTLTLNLKYFVTNVTAYTSYKNADSQ